jgi:hypothetical protein
MWPPAAVSRIMPGTLPRCHGRSRGPRPQRSAGSRGPRVRRDQSGDLSRAPRVAARNSKDSVAYGGYSVALTGGSWPTNRSAKQ